MNQVSALKQGFTAAVPVAVGYIPIAMAFGMLAKSVDISLLDTSLFSLLVFAGASQFMALDLIQSGISAGDIILATFLLNLRHLMMSASLAVRLQTEKKRWLPFIAFGITDESFAVASLTAGKLPLSFLLALQGSIYCAWVAGTLLGYLLGTSLPAAIQGSLVVGLYAMFTAILVPAIKESSGVFYLAALSGLIYAAIDQLQLLPAGWNLITSIIFSALAGLYLLKNTGQEESL